MLADFFFDFCGGAAWKMDRARASRARGPYVFDVGVRVEPEHYILRTEQCITVAKRRVQK